MDRGGRIVPPLSASSPRIARRPAKRTLPRWARRSAKAALLLAAAGTIAAGWRSGWLATFVDQSRERIVARSVVIGFRVSAVEITGRSHTDAATLLSAAHIAWGAPILAFSPEDARRQIEALPWAATVERRLPGTIAITIIERTPIALWQHNNKFALIDADGDNLETIAIDAAPPELPLVVGGDAPAHARDFLALLAAYPAVAKRVQASSWIGSRRWDLKLDNGVQILLPEDGVAEAVRQLSDAEESSRLFERDVAAIDLRVPGKMVVRLAHEPNPAALAAKPKPQQGI
jgi:cell division protein FtsQ